MSQDNFRPMNRREFLKKNFFLALMFFMGAVVHPFLGFWKKFQEPEKGLKPARYYKKLAG